MRDVAAAIATPHATAMLVRITPPTSVIDKRIVYTPSRPRRCSAPPLMLRHRVPPRCCRFQRLCAPCAAVTFIRRQRCLSAASGAAARRSAAAARRFVYMLLRSRCRLCSAAERHATPPILAVMLLRHDFVRYVRSVAMRCAQLSRRRCAAQQAARDIDAPPRRAMRAARWRCHDIYFLSAFAMPHYAAMATAYY